MHYDKLKKWSTLTTCLLFYSILFYSILKVEKSLSPFPNRPQYEDTLLPSGREVRRLLMLPCAQTLPTLSAQVTSTFPVIHGCGYLSWQGCLTIEFRSLPLVLTLSRLMLLMLMLILMLMRMLIKANKGPFLDCISEQSNGTVMMLVDDGVVSGIKICPWKINARKSTQWCARKTC